MTPSHGTRHHEIERETTDHTGVSQKISNLGGVMGNRARISWIGWKDTAEITLPARAAEHLIVSGKKFYFTKRRDAQLHARTAHFLRSDADPFFNNSAASAKLRCVVIEADFAELESHRAHTVENGGIIKLVQIRQIDGRVSFAGDAFVQFHDRLFHRGSLRAHLNQRRDDSINAGQVVESKRMINSGPGE